MPRKRESYPNKCVFCKKGIRDKSKTIHKVCEKKGGLRYLMETAEKINQRDNILSGCLTKQEKPNMKEIVKP